MSRNAPTVRHCVCSIKPVSVLLSVSARAMLGLIVSGVLFIGRIQAIRAAKNVRCDIPPHDYRLTKGTNEAVRERALVQLSVYSLDL